MQSVAPTESRDKESNRFEALDLLRLFAVAAVVIFHYGFRGVMGTGHLSVVWLPAIAPIICYGYIGVKLFFVISGFVISFSAQNRNMVQFAVARACRLFPAFAFCMTVTCLVTLAIGGGVFQASLGKWIANLTMVIPLGFPRLAMDGAYWSIFAEITFYGWIALLLASGWFARHLTTAVVIWLLISALNALTINSAIVERLFITSQSGFFAAGVMLFVLRKRDRNHVDILVFGLATTLATLQALNEAFGIPDLAKAPLNATMIVALSIGCVLLVTAATQIKRTPLPPKFVIALGGLTYPLYLLHQNIGYMIFNRVGDAMPATVLVLAVSSAMLVASYLTWRYVERPGQRLMRQALENLIPSGLLPKRPFHQRLGSPKSNELP